MQPSTIALLKVNCCCIGKLSQWTILSCKLILWFLQELVPHPMCSIKCYIECTGAIPRSLTICLRIYCFTLARRNFDQRNCLCFETCNNKSITTETIWSLRRHFCLLGDKNVSLGTFLSCERQFQHNWDKIPTHCSEAIWQHRLPTTMLWLTVDLCNIKSNK